MNTFFNIPNDIIAGVAVPCAWCLHEQGLPAGEGSHGICRQHADQLLIQWRKQRRKHGPVVA